ncbi:MAG TPA: hypothetical protein VEV41_14195 [Terriglobales bacterium]|nr:hypothetical protein [Terriglobales bacterium]
MARSIDITTTMIIGFALSGLAFAAQPQEQSFDFESFAAKCEVKDTSFKNADSFARMDPKQEWKQIKEQDENAECAEYCETARLWRDNSGHVRVVSMGYTSGSGDWSAEVDSCYGVDGRISAAASLLNTFYGNFKRERIMTFNRHGTVLDSSEMYFDLNTGKKITAPAEATDASYGMNQISVYRTVRELPFRNLLKDNAFSGSNAKTN